MYMFYARMMQRFVPLSIALALHYSFVYLSFSLVLLFWVEGGRGSGGKKINRHLFYMGTKE